MAYPIDRRTFLRRGGGTLGAAAALGLAGPAVLEACSSSKSSSSSSSSGGTATTAAGGSSSVGGTSVKPVAAGTYGSMAFNLPWVKDVESAGEYIADSNGYYKQLGFSSVDLVSGGPSATPQETTVETGRVLMAVTSLDSTAAAIQKGHPLVVVGTEYQKNPFCIMSLQSKPITTPQGMIGKKIGVQAPNDAVWAAFLKANSLDAGKITKVPVQFDPTPLAQGQVDGWFSFITNEPIELGLQGIKTTTFLLNDFNYPEIGNVFIVKTDTLKASRDKIKALMIAEIIAWRESIQKPDEGATLTVQKYGTGLTMPAEQQQSRAQNLLMGTGDALQYGLFYVSPTAQAANIKTLGLGGITVTASQLFDMTLLDEIYSAYPDLKTVPSAGT